MKLRLRGDSLRFRLTKTEVTHLHGQGWWQDAAAFGHAGTPRLRYRIEAAEADEPGVRFTSGEDTVITVLIPASQIAAWAGGNEVGIYFATEWNLKVAVEKDFRCLEGEREEDEADNFDNPNAGTAVHGECRAE